jgi:hypothetical protein
MRFERTIPATDFMTRASRTELGWHHRATDLLSGASSNRSTPRPPCIIRHQGFFLLEQRTVLTSILPVGIVVIGIRSRCDCYISRIRVSDVLERVGIDFIPSDMGHSHGRLWRFVLQDGRNGYHWSNWYILLVDRGGSRDGNACRFGIFFLSIALKLQEYLLVLDNELRGSLPDGDVRLELKCGVALEHESSVAHACFRPTPNRSSDRRSVSRYS